MGMTRASRAAKMAEQAAAEAALAAVEAREDATEDGSEDGFEDETTDPRERNPYTIIEKLGDDGQYWHVTRVVPGLATEEYVAKKYGAGNFRCTEYGYGKPRGKKKQWGTKKRFLLRIDPSAVPAKPEVNPLAPAPEGPNINMALLSMMMQNMQQGQELHRAMLQTMLESTKREPPATDPLLIEVVRGIASREKTDPLLIEMVRSAMAREKNGTGGFKEMFEAFREFRNMMDGVPDHDEPAWLQGLKAATPVVEKILSGIPRAQPTSAPRENPPATSVPAQLPKPAEAPPEAPPAGAQHPLLTKLDKQIIPHLMSRAVAEGLESAEFYAEWALRMITDEELQLFEPMLDNDELLTELVARYPYIEPQRAYFAAVLAAMREQLTPDDDTPDPPAEAKED